MKQIIYFTKKIYSYAGNILIFNFVVMIVIGLLESIGILLIIPLLTIVGILKDSTNNLQMFSWILNSFKGVSEILSLSFILSLYVLINIGQSLFSRNQVILNKKIQHGFIRHLREETYKSIIQSNWGFFLDSRKSDIVKIMTTEIAKVKKGTHLFLQCLSSLVFTIIQIGIAFLLSAKMTVFILFFGLVLMFFSRHFIKKSKLFGKDNNQLSKTYIAGISDHLNGMKDIKSNTLEKSHLIWFSSLCQKVEDNSIEFIKLKATSQFIYKVIAAILIALFIFFSVRIFNAQPTQLLLIIVIFSRLWPAITSIQATLEKLASIVPSFEALIDLQNRCKNAREFMVEEIKNTKPFILKEGLECSNVFFRYHRSEPTFTLKDINLHIPSNKMTAIVGSSGAGKSTLIDLILGLNQAEKGGILIDGIALTTENLLSLRRSISYVPQEPFLFNASLRDNMKLIDPNASDDQIWEALEFASAKEFVVKLPKGLDTLIGDQGIRLSGGERQRIVLARAILRKPSILILDEATSALDTENEVKIQYALEQLKGRMTIIVVAHRLSTIRNADQIVVLDQGAIIQKGDFWQLSREERGVFSHLLTNQMEVS